MSLTHPTYPSSLALAQNDFSLEFEDLGLYVKNSFWIARHWMRENGFHIITQWDAETSNWINYTSHSWHWVRDPGTPYQLPEHTRECSVCGLEDMGHPDEFDIEYPNCADVGRDE